MKEETIDYTPDQAMHVALELQVEGRLAEAESIFRGVLELEPENYHGLTRLAALLAEKKEYYEALYRVDRALRIKSRSPAALANRGVILGQLGHPAEAEGDLRKALHHEPENPIIWNNLSNTLERLGRYEEAFMAINKCLGLRSNHATSYFNRGVILIRLQRYRDAILSFDHSLALDADQPDSRYNRGVCNLLLGDLPKGWPDYEHRLISSVDDKFNIGPFVEPQWTGSEPLEGKTILLHSEQGVGDSIHFMRYLQLVLDKNPAKVLFLIHKALRPLLAHLDSRVTLLTGGETYPPFDYWSALMSLPHCFGTTLDTIPAPWQMPLDNTELTAWRARTFSVRPKVGICWSGNWKHKNDAHRSIAFKRFRQALDGVEAEFFSLQKDIRDPDLADFCNSKIIDLAPGLHTLADTAHAISVLDLVVSVDTSVAHLAASVGTKTWTLIPMQNTDWRWMLNRRDSPWYPAMTLYRQQRVGDWDTVLRFVRNDLRALPAQVQRAA